MRLNYQCNHQQFQLLILFILSSLFFTYTTCVKYIIFGIGTPHWWVPAPYWINNINRIPMYTMNLPSLIDIHLLADKNNEKEVVIFWLVSIQIKWTAFGSLFTHAIIIISNFLVNKVSLGWNQSLLHPTGSGFLQLTVFPSMGFNDHVFGIKSDSCRKSCQENKQNSCCYELVSNGVRIYEIWSDAR